MLCLVNVLWDQVLDVVFCVKGLDKCCSGNVVWIVFQVEFVKYEQDVVDVWFKVEDNVELIMDYVLISYGKVVDIVKLFIIESK